MKTVDSNTEMVPGLNLNRFAERHVAPSFELLPAFPATILNGRKVGTLHSSNVYSGYWPNFSITPNRGQRSKPGHDIGNTFEESSPLTFRGQFYRFCGSFRLKPHMKRDKK